MAGNYTVSKPTKAELDLIKGSVNYANKTLVGYTPLLIADQQDLSKTKQLEAKTKATYQTAQASLLNTTMAFNAYKITNPTDTSSATFLAKQKAKTDAETANSKALNAYRSATENVALLTEDLNNARLYVNTAAKALGLDAKALINDVKLPANQKGGKSDSKTAPGTGFDGKRPKQAYKYNAPMVQYAYFNSESGNPLAIAFTSGNARWPQPFNDAATGAFKLKNSRGVIQMSAEVAYNIANNKPYSKGEKLLKQPYGFRFHYNPQSIAMSYGMVDNLSPEFLSSGKDQINPVTPLNNGTTFRVDIYLNRIEDMVVLKSDGSLNTSTNTVTDVYPEDVSQQERKEIYKKGTMYDVEYLFRAVNGGAADYNSALRGITSDKGWLYGPAVEVHLGSNLRYLGQLTNITLNHTIFNERMVPTLTIASLTFKRFYDLPAIENKVPTGKKKK